MFLTRASCLLSHLFFRFTLRGQSDRVHFDSSPKQVLDSEYSDYVDHLMELWDVKGTSIAVVKPGGEIELGAWGNRTEEGEVMTPETLFGIASCSEAFLASSLGVLFDDYAHGRNTTPLPDGLQELNWDTKVKEILPAEWQLLDEWATNKANIRDILSHMSGLPRHDHSLSTSDSPADIIQRIKYLRPVHELRQKMSYNNQMYVVGAHILSKYTGSYTDFATERIFSPLGMDSTTFALSEAIQSGQLTETWSAFGQRIPYWNTGDDKELNAGPGGVISNVVDLSQWVKLLLRTARSESDSPLPKSVFDEVTTSGVVMTGLPIESGFSIAGYGMGWMRSSYQGHDTVFHSGSIPGLISHISFFPEDDFGVVTLLNTNDKGRVARALHYRVAEHILGLPRLFKAGSPPPPPDPPGRSNTTTPLPLSVYSGTYKNPGYGNFVLCDPEATSHYCDSVLSDFRKVDSARSLPHPPDSDVKQLLAEWPRMWSSHVRLAHAENNTNKFDLSFTNLFPDGYGASKTPFESYEGDSKGQVEFVIDGGTNSVIGFGYFGQDDMAGVRREGASIQGGAIAWFDKV